jgi:alcohol dehydrogenase class IV
MANRIMLNETSYHGAGAIEEIANEAKAHDFKKAFVCSDPDLIKFGVTKKVTDVLDKNGLAYEIYSDIKANPTIENVQHGVEAFKKSGADYLIAIGGGSSMDTSKAIGIIMQLRVVYHKQHLMYEPWNVRFQVLHLRIPFLQYTVQVSCLHDLLFHWQLHFLKIWK